MKILLSNDDGVHAPGIRALYQELSQSYQTTIIAPLEERSTTGHSLSLDRPLRVESLEENIYGCSGFPADCVLLGLGHVLKGSDRPDLVVSGINRGANLAQDLYYSGTIAAAREASFHGVPAIAVSLAFGKVNETHHYQSAAKFIHLCVEMGLHRTCPLMNVININVPNLEWSKIKGARLTQIGFRNYSEEIHARVDSRSRDYYWIAGHYEGHDNDPLSDCSAVDDGFIAVTPHALVEQSNKDYTNLEQMIKKINEKF